MQEEPLFNQRPSMNPSSGERSGNRYQNSGFSQQNTPQGSSNLKDFSFWRRDKKQSPDDSPFSQFENKTDAPTRPYTQHDQNFHRNYQQMQSNEAEGSFEWEEERQSPFKFIITLAVIVMGLGIAWFSFQWFSNIGSTGPVVIEPEEGPYKVRPENPGGTQFPHGDMSVYNRLDTRNQPQAVERLLPQSEQPLHPPTQNQLPPPQQEYMQQQAGSRALSFQQSAQNASMVREGQEVSNPALNPSISRQNVPLPNASAQLPMQQDQDMPSNDGNDYPEEESTSAVISSPQQRLQNVQPKTSSYPMRTAEEDQPEEGPYLKHPRQNAKYADEVSDNNRNRDKEAAPARKVMSDTGHQQAERPKQKNELKLEDDPELREILAKESKQTKSKVNPTKKGYRVRLASIKDDYTKAKEELDRLKGVQVDLPKDATLYIQKTTSANGATYYSIMAGQLDSHSLADTVCKRYRGSLPSACSILKP